MKNNYQSIYRKSRVLICSVFIFTFVGCSKWLEVPAPSNQIDASEVFQDSSTANAALIGIYSYMHNYNFVQETAFRNVVSNIGGRLSDEFKYYQNAAVDEFGINVIYPDNQIVLNLWSDLYQAIYYTNSVLQRIAEAENISTKFKNQLTGEALFLRSFCFFYLVNYFGDVPLVTTIDVTTNEKLARNLKADVYTQLIKDLIEAKGLMSEDYEYVDPGRGRATPWAARALLSRIYLYTGQFDEAESEASKLINAADLFELSDVGSVFVATSQEAIWRFNSNTGRTHIQDVLSPNQQTKNPRVVCTDSFLQAFEAGDTRFTTWIGKITALDGKDYYYPSKYKYTTESNVNGNEADVVLRLSEQYLIRAEARSRKQSTDISGAIEDLKHVRSRAGLTTELEGANTSSLLKIIAKERRTELFTEYSHRWFDLVRTEQADAVLKVEKPQTWKPYAIKLPIPQNARNSNISLTQNDGYPQ